MPRKKKTFRNPNGFGTVYKLSGNRRRPYIAKYPIRVEFMPDMKRKYKQVYEIVGYYETKEEAQEALLHYKKNLRNHKIQNIKNITFKEVYDDMKKLKFPKIGQEAQEKYQWAYKKFEALHDIPFSEIELYEFQDILDKEKLKKDSKQKLKSFLNAMYSHAIPRKITDVNYARYLVINSDIKGNEPLHKPFTSKEIKTLWANINKIKDIDTILVMIYMGYRPSEMLSIRRKSINLEERYIKGGIKTETGKNRFVPIPDKIMPFIKKRLSQTDDYLFCDTKRHKYSYDYYLKKIFKNIMNQLDMDHRPHDGRHTFTTILSNVDANPTTIKKLVGHKNFKQTEDVYIHKNIDQLREAINKI